jgi:hypothetical protein
MLNKWTVLSAFLVLFSSCAKEAGEGGLASIKGMVVKNVRLILSNPASFQYAVPAADYDVFIVYGNNVSPNDRIWTNFDGAFEFEGLRTGDYTVYVYSRDTTGLPGVDPERMVVKTTVEIKERNEEVVLNDFQVYDIP